jgi:hypothetical protein
VIDLVNAPDCDTAVFVGGCALTSTPARSAHRRVLDLRDGLLTRSTVFGTRRPSHTSETVRCNMPTAGLRLRVEVTPGEPHGRDLDRERIDGDRRTRTPAGLPGGHGIRPADQVGKWARSQHLMESSRSVDGDALYLEMRTMTRAWRGLAAATAFSSPPLHRWVRQRSTRITEQSVHRVAPGETVRMDKLVAL